MRLNIVFAIIILAFTALPLSAGELPVRSMEASDGLTAVINDGDTFFYGFDVIPTDPSVDLDGIAASGAGDFHTSSQPDYDTGNGLALNLNGSGAESLMRTDFTNSLWRAQFIDSPAWTVEAKVNITGTGTEGSAGVFGLYAANNHGSKDIRIGKTFVRDNST
ncbi:MAG: hypothetical protein KAS23_01055, partial [Anaerohalosphaera sp.]|nr:hypothetical protein [Anaerohalosphaera sp.]